jgi:hypothetical protein
VTRERKAIVGAAAVVVLALLGYLFAGPLVGLGVLVVGALGLVVVLQRTADVDDEVVETEAKERKPRKSRSAGSDRLSELSGGAGTGPMLPTWSPPVEEAPAEPEAPTTNWAEGWSNDDDWDAGSADASIDAAVDLEPNPLDEIASLEDVDVIAEVERFEVPSLADEPVLDEIEIVEIPSDTTGLPTLDAYPINEEVSTADDIMAASQATELTVNESAGENAELAKLLAKVQARLAAYE